MVIESNCLFVPRLYWLVFFPLGGNTRISPPPPVGATLPRPGTSSQLFGLSHLMSAPFPFHLNVVAGASRHSSDSRASRHFGRPRRRRGRVRNMRRSPSGPCSARPEGGPRGREVVVPAVETG